MAQLPTSDDRWTETVRIQVGSNKQQWIVHPLYLTRDSKFFRTALTRRWPSGRKGAVNVDHVDPWLLSKVLEWCYGHNFPFAELLEGFPGYLKWDPDRLRWDKETDYQRMAPPSPELHWLFKNRESDWERDRDTTRRSSAETDFIYVNLIRMYISADELFMDGLRQYIVDLLNKEHDVTCDLGPRRTPPEAVRLAWCCLPENDPLLDGFLSRYRHV